MAHWKCSMAYRQATTTDGAHASGVTWPVRLARWWEARRERGWSGRPDVERTPDTSEMWERVERAFRLLDVADQRPDPGLTRLVAASLLDEVASRLAGVGGEADRSALERAVRVVREQISACDDAPHVPAGRAASR